MSSRVQTRAPSPLQLPDGRPAADAWTLAPEIKHLNHGSFGAVPRVVQEQQNALRAEMDSAPVVWFPALPHRLADARPAIADFLGAETSDLAWVPNASAGASVVYNSLTLAPGSDIVVTDHGYGAVTMGAERLARRIRGSVRTAEVPLFAGPERSLQAIVDAITENTELIVLDQITSATARFMPVREVSRIARERGIPLLVDAAHVPGLVADPLDGLDCDFWVGNLHKFACAPRGAAVLVARGRHQQELYPVIDSWGAPESYPARFDHQGTLDQTSYLSAHASLDLVERYWGWGAARTYMSDLADYAENIIVEAMNEVTGVESRVDVGMPVNALRIVRLPDGLANSVATANSLRDRVTTELGVEGGFTSFGGAGYFRLSTHVYNTASDYEYFAERCVPELYRWSRQ
ncbi:aminotransferase class V-fold PLP-dependent enzyme [Lysinibacter sp. HNR]|uniref:aminotransferase class V-fold PLP-dependent enzyme n=1 Tax=Lysinibacter sp. HNR TaxID=3031408 RepID=UPI002435E506|nr:aminotransferase class V-fold PLP-dependent enzyme [Lysinibacter sp. HNR]WGD37218.1 aminotransferase class V-fold PLP-dependent enzyme [Lysinibacter sp. HNR]